MRAPGASGAPAPAPASRPAALRGLARGLAGRPALAPTSALAFALALAIGAALAPAGARRAAADLGGFAIRDLRTELTVEPDADLLVEETIRVDFEAPRHGLYRTIPVRYTDPRGFDYGLRLKLLGVEDEHGRSQPTRLTREGRYLMIRIGDPDRTVSGRRTYVIRYRVQGAVAHLDSHDELYWNAVGTEWGTPVEHAEALVHLPAGVPPDEVETAAYAGPFGGDTVDVEVTRPAPSTVRYEALRPLATFEGLTVVAGWPHGHVAFPSAFETWLWRILRNWVLLLPLVALGWSVRRYRVQGRDPVGGGSIPVRYAPPEGVGPAEIGTIVDEQVDLRDVTAIVVDLAVRGFLRIEVQAQQRLFTTDQETVFVRLAEVGDARLDGLLPHERKVFDGIFKHGDRVADDALENAFYTELPVIQAALYRHLVKAGYFDASPTVARWGQIGFAVAWALGALAAGGVGGWLSGSIFPTAWIVPGLAAALCAAVVAAFVKAMPRRTAAGVALREWALGFEEFVARVESDALERADAVTAFERLLPYAMALGVAARWAQRFEGIYEAGRGPGWYVGPNAAGPFSTTAFERSLGASMGGVAKSMAAAPRSSSGSGFGGSSGGGGGGGGGGSW